MESVAYSIGRAMLNITQWPVSLLITISVFVVFVAFVWFAMSCLRYYFNRYEPVYTLTETGSFEKNHIASRFCKIIISNTITDQCLMNVENIGLWMVASNIVNNWERDSIMSIKQMHREVIFALEKELDEQQLENIKTNLIKLELALNSNLLKSKIPTPPYMRTSTYASWVTQVLSTLNNS